MKTALVTGGAKRIGAKIVKTLHSNNYNVIIHYRNSESDALSLVGALNNKRKNSATSIQADLTLIEDINALRQKISGLDLLVNSASVFYPTPINKVDQDSWSDIINTNMMAPFFLSTSLSAALSSTNGCIVNIIDIHSERPLIDHSIYNISKSGLAMMTKSLAKDLAPNIRVCGVSPGSILWPENEHEMSQNQKNTMIDKIPLKRQGKAKDIADTVVFLANSPYITGQIISVDGGRSLNQ
jgi:pteridine reductase